MPNLSLVDNYLIFPSNFCRISFLCFLALRLPVLSSSLFPYSAFLALIPVKIHFLDKSFQQ